MKKEYSLALWWWAARWFAHIWVIKYLEENNICINEISGTSIWAIIWWLYALWKTSKEIEEFAKSINYFKLIDLDFKLGLFKGKNVYEKLKEIFLNKKIEDLDISLKIVATNIEYTPNCSRVRFLVKIRIKKGPKKYVNKFKM